MFSNNAPISNATVKLITASSSSLELSSVSNNQGAFTFDKVLAGNYNLTVTSIGFVTISKAITVGNSPVDLGIIKISEKAQTLKDVVVNGDCTTSKTK